MAPIRPHKCAECTKAFPTPAALKLHVAIHSDERPHVCDVCLRGFNDLRALRRHRNTVHKQTKGFECDECHTFFTRAENVRRHKLEKHATDVGTARNDGADERPYVCATCGLGFKGRRTLWNHKKIHDPERKFQCPKCHKFLSRKSNFPRHKRTCLRLQSADTVSAGEESSPDDDEERLAFDDPVPEEAEVDNDAVHGEDVDMLELDANNAEASCDASIELYASAPPVGAGQPIDAEPSDGPDQQDLATHDEVCQTVDEAASSDFRHNDGNAVQYRFRSDSSDDDGDDAGTQSDGEQDLIQYVPVQPTRTDQNADRAAFIGLENLFLRHVQSLEDQFQRLTLRQWTPSEVLLETFAFLSRLDLAKAAMACRRYRNLSSTFDTLLHIANLVVEPVSRGRRFGSRDQWSSASRVVVWYELGPERASGAYRTFQTVPKALEFVAQRGLLQMSYVENLTFRQTGAGDIPNYVWQHLGRSLTFTEIDQWTIDGLRLGGVAGFGNILTPFNAVKKVRSYNIRNCPYISAP